MALGEQSLSLLGLICEFEEQYDVSTVLYAAGYFSVLHLKKTPQELLQQELFRKRLKDFYVKYLSPRIKQDKNM